ncbi:MAG: pseudouridine synthase, partial [Chitinophagales bacterium]
LDKTTANAMMEQFRNRIVQKTYYAIVRGYLPEGKQTIDYPLYKGELRSGEKQAAVTHYERLAQIEVPIPVDRYAQSRYSLVRIHPKTGRMHQIRKHFAHLRHPIIGDRKHGDRHHNRMFREKYEMSKLLLHAQELQFTHPSTQQNVYIHAPFSEAMKQVVSLFDWTVHLSLSQ